MGGRFGSQRAPRNATVLVALVLLAIGVLGTFLGLIPAIAGISGATIGILAYVAATIVMLLGIFLRGL
ncbi:MAG TPA: hypothetical protein VNT28_01055 [Candidatus Limnocylindrales bacterium]|jgi:EamA domain-containing membrane protein RarD|nr:hypothetical protein [Candidatus Limnocylindrales bacterium]